MTDPNTAHLGRYPGVSLALAVFLAGAPVLACAQATATAAKQYGIAVFAGGTRVKPDYGPQADYGLIVGGDFTRHFHLFDPSLEVRYSHATGTTVGENFFAGGLKVEKLVFNRFHPYADMLIGKGNINFNFPQIFPQGPYSHDDSIIYVLGGGVDYDLSPRFAVKGDFQYQAWKLGSNANSTLSPTSISAGVVYRIPFSALRPRRR